MSESIRIYVQSDRVPGAIAVVDLAQELEEQWTAFNVAVDAEMLRTLQRLPGERERVAYLCRTIAERIKWTAQSVLSADPACRSLNDVITAAGDRARGAVVKELIALRETRLPRSIEFDQELALIVARHGYDGPQSPAAG